MKKVLIVPLFMLLTACSGGDDFKASADVQAHVRNTLTEVVTSAEVEIQRDDISIYVENSDGVSIEEHYHLSKPNVFDGRYKIEYKCEDVCLVTYDERAAEVLNDKMLIALFDKHVKGVVEALDRKSKMTSNP